MAEYFEYLREMLEAFFGDLGYFFYRHWFSPWEDVGNNFDNYNAIFNNYSGSFGFWGWFFYIFFLIFFIGLIGAIIYGIYFLISGMFCYSLTTIAFSLIRIKEDKLRWLTES